MDGLFLGLEAKERPLRVLLELLALLILAVSAARVAETGSVALMVAGVDGDVWVATMGGRSKSVGDSTGTMSQ